MASMFAAGNVTEFSIAVNVSSSQLVLNSFAGWGWTGSAIILVPDAPSLVQPAPVLCFLPDSSSSRTSSHLAVGLGVGLGVGLPLLALLAAGALWLWAKRRLARWVAAGMAASSMQGCLSVAGCTPTQARWRWRVLHHTARCAAAPAVLAKAAPYHVFFAVDGVCS